MHIVLVRSHRAIKMLNRIDVRRHRQQHLNHANEMRKRAKFAFDAGIIDEDMLNNYLAEAIAFENARCMDKEH